MEQQPTTSARPTFLTVLCILSFIAGAYGIYSGISGYFTADTAAGLVGEAMDNASNSIKNSDNASKAVEGVMNSISDAMSPEKIKNNAIAGVLASILTLIGAWMMWNLQKKGFWIYLAGTVVSIVAPLVVFGGGLMGLATGGVSAFFGVLFVILYAINLKHMS
jgi:type III secretory pathway component EscR